MAWWTWIVPARIYAIQVRLKGRPRRSRHEVPVHKGYILLNCDLGAEEYIVEELRRIGGVKVAHLTFGAYDVLAEVHAENGDEFERIVSSRVRKLSRVVSTMTLSVADS